MNFTAYFSKKLYQIKLDFVEDFKKSNKELNFFEQPNLSKYPSFDGDDFIFFELNFIPYYVSLYQIGDIITLNLSIDFERFKDETGGLNGWYEDDITDLKTMNIYDNCLKLQQQLFENDVEIYEKLRVLMGKTVAKKIDGFSDMGFFD